MMATNTLTTSLESFSEDLDGKVNVARGANQLICTHEARKCD